MLRWEILCNKIYRFRIILTVKLSFWLLSTVNLHVVGFEKDSNTITLEDVRKGDV